MIVPCEPPYSPMRKQVLFLLTAALIISACNIKSPSTESIQKPSLDWVAIADKIVLQSKLQPGERVILVSLPGEFNALVPLLETKISDAGALYLGTISVDSLVWPEEWKTDFVKATVGKSQSDLVGHFGDVDLGIMLPGASPAHVPYAALQEVLNLGKGRTIHFHWSGAYDLSGQVMGISDKVSLFYTKALVETDYEGLSKIQQDFEKAVRQGEVVVTTPAGTNIRFMVGDRPVTKQDGDASLEHILQARNLIDREIELPAGAIRVAPLEESVEGTIAFPDGVWNNQKVEGLVLTFKKGKVIDIKAKSGVDAVKAELDKAGDAGHSFRELAVGFNPLLAIPNENPWIPYYGYGAGVIRLSLGDNTELGGIVTGGYVRWNFFIDATLVVGNETWIEDGRLMK